MEYGSNMTKTGVTTDLHTHFAGALPARTLLEIALAANKRYPGSLLRELLPEVHGERVALRRLAPAELITLQNAMQLVRGTQQPFAALECAYRYRKPITKDLELLPAQLLAIRRELQRHGTSYAELSVSNVLHLEPHRYGQPTFLGVAMAVLESFGSSYPQLRFLASVKRAASDQWKQEQFGKLRQLKKCRWISGLDIIGHENNPTSDFSAELGELMAWDRSHNAGWVYRIHAGENANHADNVRDAVELFINHRVRGRIGHGIYGTDDPELLTAMAEHGVIVEINATSNYALNNLADFSSSLPVNRYLAHGVPIVLGTDGAGIFQNSLAGELELARGYAADFAALRRSVAATEAGYLMALLAREVTLPEKYRLPAL